MAEEAKKIDVENAASPTPKEPPKRTAVAIQYDVEKNKAPLIIATGRGPIAEEILRIAEENRIPLYEDPELATLLTKLQIDTEIPAELYVLVAEVLFFVYKLDRMASKRDQVIKKLREQEKESKR